MRNLQRHSKRHIQTARCTVDRSAIHEQGVRPDPHHLCRYWYYQHPVKESDHQWIYDYYRDNIDTIIARSKEDVIAEVGINFLLAGLENDPVVEKTRKAIQRSLNRQAGIIPAVNGSTDLLDGEHRNVLAIMLLDWQVPMQCQPFRSSRKYSPASPMA